MIKTNFLLVGGLALVSLTTISRMSFSQSITTLPNIIYIYADDMGYGDLGCYGQQYIKTPNIDRLAKRGIRFTQHYTGAPVCAPARCCLLTGKHTGRAFIRNNYELSDSSSSKSGQLPLPRNEETIAETLKKSGYTTAIIGKWGLGSIESEGNPNKQGFDFFYGYADQVHAHNHFPEFLWKNDQQVFLKNNVPTVHPTYKKDETIDSLEYKKYIGTQYSLDLMTNEAISFIKQCEEKPFFLYLALVIPHKALQVPDETLKIYEKFDKEPYDGKRGYTPHPRPRAAYAAMISGMDAKVGEIVDQLERLGISENTIVMFSSDNGPAEGGGLDIRFFNSTGGLRGMKGQVYEGGIREPFIVCWPGKITPGTTTDLVSAQYDLKSTLAEIAGQNVFDTDGISFLPTLLGCPGNQKKHEYLYWEFSSGGGQCAIRMGHWKGVKRDIFRNKGGNWELYDLDKDKREVFNIAGEHPDIVARFDQIASQRIPSKIEEWNF
jgi:arylsulfatase A